MKTNTTGMSTGDRIVLEDETTKGDSYSGNVVVQEKFTDLQMITDFLFLIKVVVILHYSVSVTSSTGTNAVIKGYGDEVGKVVKVKTVELGRGYENSPTPPTLTFFNNVIVTNVSGTFISGQSVTSSSGGSGTIDSLNADIGLLKIKDVTGNFNVNDTLTSASNGTCTLKKSDVATELLQLM